MTDKESNSWEATPDQQPDGAGDAALDELGLETPAQRPRKRRWLWWLLVPVLAGVGILAWYLLKPPLDPLPYEPRAGTFGFEEFKRTHLPRITAVERIEVARAPDPVPPDRTPPDRTPPDVAVRPPDVAVRPPDVAVRTPVGPDDPTVRVPPAVDPTSRPAVRVPPDVTVTPVPDDPSVARGPGPTTRGSEEPVEVVVPDPTGPTTRGSEEPVEVVVPDPHPVPDDPTTRHAVEPGTADGTGEAGGWRLEGLAHTEPMEPGQDPRESIPKPPDYFKPENMRDGFLILSQVASKDSWKLSRDDLYARRFHTAQGKPCVDFIWPGEGHLKDAEGTLAPEGSFWIRPRQKKGNYSRYFDNQQADFYHWVGIEIPPEHKDKAAEMFEWKLANPKQPPPGWQPAGKVYEYKRGEKTRYMYVYQMPMGPLSSGVTNVDLRLYHKKSGAYLGKNSHSVTIGGTP